MISYFVLYFLPPLSAVLHLQPAHCLSNRVDFCANAARLAEQAAQCYLLEFRAQTTADEHWYPLLR